jgi:hypothetical protein
MLRQRPPRAGARAAELGEAFHSASPLKYLQDKQGGYP